MELATRYSSALKLSVLLQVGVLIACSQIFKSYIITVYCLSFVAYWLLTLVLLFTNPRSPRNWQLAIVAIGFALIYPVVWLAYRPLE